MTISHTPAYEQLQYRLEDARRLVQIHEECTGRDPGRRRGYDALNRSTVVLAVAAWEGFVEDLLIDQADRFAENAAGPTSVPEGVRSAMITHLHSQYGWSTLNPDTQKEIWFLAGRGWRSVYKQYVADKAASLNTPSATNIKKLYASTLGIKNLTTGWGARRWKPSDYRDRLDNLLTLRHQIAHGALADQTVGKTRATRAVNLIERIAGWSDKTVKSRVNSLIRTKPRSAASR